MSFNHNFPLCCWFTFPDTYLMIARKTYDSLPIPTYFFPAADSGCQSCIPCNSVQKSLLFCFRLENAHSLPLCGLLGIPFDLFILYQLPNNFFSVLFPASSYISQLISVAAPLTATLKANLVRFIFSNHFPFSEEYSVHLRTFKPIFIAIPSK